MHRDGLDVGRALVQRVDELDVAVAAQAERVRHLLLDQIIDDDLGAVEHVASTSFTLLLRLNEFLASASFYARPATGPNLFLIILYVNCYCGMVGLPASRAVRHCCRANDVLIQFAPPIWRADSVKPRPKPKTSDKPATPRKVSNGKVSIAKLVPTSEPNIDDEAEERARGGVQSLEARVFGILEEVARHREGIRMADLSKLVGLHNSTTFHLAKTLVSLGYLRQERDCQRYRVGRPLLALAASALDEIEMVNLAMPILEDLSRETGESGHFAVRMGDAVVVIARTSGPGAFQLTDRVGVVRPPPPPPPPPPTAPRSARSSWLRCALTS